MGLLKSRKYWLPAFSPFSTVFSKAFFLRVEKSGLYGKVFIPFQYNLCFKKSWDFRPLNVRMLCGKSRKFRVSTFSLLPAMFPTLSEYEIY